MKSRGHENGAGFPLLEDPDSGEHLALRSQRHHSCGAARDLHPFPPNEKNRHTNTGAHCRWLYRIQEKKDRGNLSPKVT